MWVAAPKRRPVMERRIHSPTLHARSAQSNGCGARMSAAIALDASRCARRRINSPLLYACSHLPRSFAKRGYPDTGLKARQWNSPGKATKERSRREKVAGPSRPRRDTECRSAASAFGARGRDAPATIRSSPQSRYFRQMVSCGVPIRRRRFIIQPKVARNELPWGKRTEGYLPRRGSINSRAPEMKPLAG